MRLNIRPGCRIHIVHELTDDSFRGKYKDHDIKILRKSDDDFYIIVWAPDGTYTYDGWWTHNGNDKIINAIEEALKGSCLISDPPKQ